MTVETLLRLALVPAAVWLASLAARRWGHAVSGYLGGMPMIGGPITLFLAIDLGPAFAAKSALFTLAAVAAQSAHLMALAHTGQRRGWLAALAGGWTAFGVMALVVTQLPMSLLVAGVLAVTGLSVAWRWLPRVHGQAPPPAIPSMELRLPVHARQQPPR